jgi:AraC family transcriptional regulator, regulatory protein of adaptative response / DNA-3-methyladenine glycosylase II
MMGHTARLPARTPFDGAALLAFLSARAVSGVEEVTGGRYRRSLALPHGPAVVDIVPRAENVTVTLACGDGRDVSAAADACRRLLDLDRDPGPIAGHLGADPLLGPLVRAAPGRRVPGHPDGSELAVRAVLGQQISVKAATRLAAGLVGRLGVPLPHPVGSVTHLFPAPIAIAALDPAELPMPRSRGRTLVRIAGALAAGSLVLHDGADPEAAGEQLRALPGIGPWTAGYIAMRALRDPDAFTPGDAGVRHGLLRLGWAGGRQETARLADSWRPFRAYAVQHLWSLAA